MEHTAQRNVARELRLESIRLCPVEVDALSGCQPAAEGRAFITLSECLYATSYE
jgi:hypothetical protein